MTYCSEKNDNVVGYDYNNAVIDEQGNITNYAQNANYQDEVEVATISREKKQANMITFKAMDQNGRLIELVVEFNGKNLKDAIVKSSLIVNPNRKYEELFPREQNTVLYHLSQNHYWMVLVIKASLLVISYFTYWTPLKEDNKIINSILSKWKSEEFTKRENLLKNYNDYIKTLNTDEQKNDAYNILVIAEIQGWPLGVNNFSEGGFEEYLNSKSKQEQLPQHVFKKQERAKFGESINNQRWLIYVVQLVATILLFHYPHLFSFYNVLVGLIPMGLALFNIYMNVSTPNSIYSYYDLCVIFGNAFLTVSSLAFTSFLYSHYIQHKATKLPPREVAHYLM